MHGDTASVSKQLQQKKKKKKERKVQSHEKITSCPRSMVCWEKERQKLHCFVVFFIVFYRFEIL